MSKWMFAAGFAVAFGFAAAGQAMAADVNSYQTRQISTAGVDFRDEAAVKAFYANLRHTAQAACNANPDSWRIQTVDRACYERAMAQAVQKIDRPVLTAEYRAHTTAADTAFATAY